MIASSILTGLSQFLGSEAGQKTVSEVLDRLHPEKRVDAAIRSLPTLNPLPKGEPMADTSIPVPVNVLGVTNVKFGSAGLTMTVPHPTEAGATVEVGLKLDEILTALISAVPVYAIGKAAWDARPVDEDKPTKFTYAFEAGVPSAMAIGRQLIIDAKD
jgi:hypothetical protein